MTTPKPTPTPTRTYLAVPYEDKERAKKLGARWDEVRRAWYAREVTPELQRWLPDSVPPVPREVDPRSEFALTMQEIGLVAHREHPIADGYHHYVPTVDDKRGKARGMYVLHADGVPNGYAINHRTGESKRWCAKTQLTDEQRATLRAQAAVQAERREHELRERYRLAARVCRGTLQQLVPLQDGDSSPYLERKGVIAHRGLYTSKSGRFTYVPMYDLNGQLWSMQTINAGGSKRFVDGSRTKHCFHALGGRSQLHEAAKNGVVVIAEGYATAATVADILDGAPAPVSTVATFYASNLQPVAEDIRKRYPDARIVIAADDDRSKTVNAGRKHATAASQAASARVAFPPFTPQHPESLSDWNDLDRYALEGYDRNTHRRALRQTVAAELARAHQATSPQHAVSERGSRLRR